MADVRKRNLKSLFFEVFRFGIVGVANTAVYYGFYRLFLIFIPYLPAHLIAWAISVVFSFLMNCYFTYKVRPTWKKFLAFPSTTLVNLGFTTIGTLVLVEFFGVSNLIAPIICGVLAIPFTFTLTKFILTYGRKSKEQAVGVE